MNNSLKDQSFMRIERYSVETKRLEYNHQLGFEGESIYNSFCNGSFYMKIIK